MDERLTAIYGLFDPESMLVRYIGATVNPPLRLLAHVQSCKPGLMPNGGLRDDTLRVRWLREMEAQGKAPGMVVLQWVVRAEWRAREQAWISWFRSSGADILNNEPRRGDGRRHGTGRAPEPSDIHPDVLRAFRTQRGWSQGELSRRLGVHYSAVSLWEAGKRRIPKTVGLAMARIESQPR